MDTKKENGLEALVRTRMPYGRYKNYRVCDLPENYLVWYRQKGFPQGKLGELMGLMYEIQLNGLEYLLKPIKDSEDRRF
ncbi:MAG: DUF3820 family protein [Paludibacteraceae bacterium]|nr:DUF3820 family protein [Paludibacteraceae bacterium]